MERIYKCPKDNTDHIISQKNPYITETNKDKEKKSKKKNER